ncbi:Coiled-coil domain-containing protein 12 [Bagarius yarrelli]|uniref:Coiled-coil domain-containing protein 12 n=1 Tax=Bagarius yarrelli TaxID=175774 RepID=A0A556VAM5_BAGYA|nr:Coiled-coil domain-containing protein 12 [Bagarius yarrelli]
MYDVILSTVTAFKRLIIDDPCFLLDSCNRTDNRSQSDLRMIMEQQAVSALQAQALKRKERLKALKDRKLQGREPAEGEPDCKRAVEEVEPEERHSNMIVGAALGVCIESDLFGFCTPTVEDKVQDQLEAANPEPIIEEVDLANLAPRKPDWDLKRDVAKKLDKLERRTQKAIAELIRDRLKRSETELAAAVGAVTVEEADSD